jgi:hypothetical protein
MKTTKESAKELGVTPGMLYFARKALGISPISEIKNGRNRYLYSDRQIAAMRAIIKKSSA